MVVNLFAGAMLVIFAMITVRIYLEMKKEDKEIKHLAEEGKKRGLRC